MKNNNNNILKLEPLKFYFNDKIPYYSSKYYSSKYYEKESYRTEDEDKIVDKSDKWVKKFIRFINHEGDFHAYYYNYSRNLIENQVGWGAWDGFFLDDSVKKCSSIKERYEKYKDEPITYGIIKKFLYEIDYFIYLEIKIVEFD